MNVDLFDFTLPHELIAQQPVSPRDSAKLLDLRDGQCIDRHVHDLPTLLKPGDLIVGNNTRVIQARLLGRTNQAKIEVTLHKQQSNNSWLAFAKPARKLKLDRIIQFANDFQGVVVDKRNNGEILLQFNQSGYNLFHALKTYGVMPLPPYIKRNLNENNDSDKTNYQTIYSKIEGAVAAPTAGLHFTERLMNELSHRSIEFVTITLHVGAGTFLPVKVKDTNDHIMHSEWGEIDQDTAIAINQAKAKGGRIIAIGTTVLRLLETVADEEGFIHPFNGDTDIFITPGYHFKTVDMLLTNFHLPRSTLFMLVSAFSGLKQMKNAYDHAIKNQYRFYSFGDCCLLQKDFEGRP